MAYPTLHSASRTDVAANDTQTVVAIPDGSNVNGYLVIIEAARDGTGGFGWPSGWTQLFLTSDSGAASCAEARYHIVDGSEGWDGTGDTITLTHASEETTAQVYVYSVWHGTTPPEAASVAHGSTINPDPPSLTPSWGAADTAWHAGSCIDGGLADATAFPANYTLNQSNTNTGGSGAISSATARRELNAASENPGTFTYDSSDTAVAWTIAVRPSGASTVTAAAHGRAHAKATSTASLTVIAAAHGRAHSRAQANDTFPGVSATIHGRAHSRSTVTSVQIIGAAAHGRAHARATAVRSESLLGAAHGRARSRAKAIARFLQISAGVSRARGRSAAFGDLAGIHYITANSIDILEMMAPLSPERYDTIGAVRSRKPLSLLGTVSHIITSPSGESRNPLIGDWATEDNYIGGFGPAEGKITFEEFYAHREVYVAGSKWRAIHSQSGECLWAGKLNQPDVHQDGTVSLIGRGWGEIFLNRPFREAILYAHYGPEGWVDANQEIGNFTQDGDTSWNVDLNGGSITFRREKDTSRTFPDGQNRAVIFARPGTQLSRVQFYLEAVRSGGGTVSFEIFVSSGRAERYDDNGNLFNNLSQDIVIPTDLGTGYNVEYDVDLGVDNAPENPWGHRDIDFIAIGISSNSTGITEGLNVQLRDIRVLGEPLETNQLTVGQLVRDLCYRRGIPTDYIYNSGPDILPFELEPGSTKGEAIEYAMLMSRRRFSIRGERPIPYFTVPEERSWTALHEHHEQDLVPNERYDTILVPWRAGTDATVTGYRKVFMENSPLERRNNYGALDWPYPIRFRQTSGGAFGADDQRAEDLGLSVLKVLSQDRRSGQGRVTEVVDENGVRQSARLIQAGDRLRYAFGEYTEYLLVTKVRQSDSAVDLEFDNEISTFLDRRRERRELKHAKKLG